MVDYVLEVWAWTDGTPQDGRPLHPAQPRSPRARYQRRSATPIDMMDLPQSTVTALPQ